MKQISIVGNVNGEDQLWLNRAYVNYFSQYGNVSIVDPFSNELKETDLLVLPGGSDVNPARYGTPWLPVISLPNRAYEYFDEVVLPHYVKSNTPIFGICRGLQTLNVLFGGTLKPHCNEPVSYADGSAAHWVKDVETQELFKCSSNHHQAIGDLADGFLVTAVGYPITNDSKKGAVLDPKSKQLEIEGIRHANLPIRAVQFHPEKNFNGNSCMKINEKFVEPQILELLNYQKPE